MRNLEFKTHDAYYIHTPTHSIYSDCIKVLDEMGYTWASLIPLLGKNRTPHMEESTILLLRKNKTVQYGDTNYSSFKNHPDYVIPYKELLGEDTQELYEGLLHSLDHLQKKLGEHDETS